MDAAVDAATVGFRAMVCKSHHHSMQTDILALESVGLRDTGVRVVGGVALNRTVGGLNPYAVELALRMGGRVVWFPTIASSAHIEFHASHHSGFPVSGIPLRDNEPITILDGAGGLLPEVHDILSVIAAESAVLNCGHLPAAEIDVLIPAAVAAGDRADRHQPPRLRRAGGAGAGRRGAGRARRWSSAWRCSSAPGRRDRRWSGRRSSAARPGWATRSSRRTSGRRATRCRSPRTGGWCAACSTPAPREDDITAMVGGNAGQLLEP